MVYHILLLVGILAALASVYSFYLGVVFDRKVSASISKPRSGFTPRVALIMPSKGAESGLEANIEAVLKQDYKTYFTIIVTECPGSSLHYCGVNPHYVSSHSMTCSRTAASPVSQSG